MLNGIGSRMEVWQPLAHRLAAERDVVLVDAPGTGDSPVPRRPRRMPDLAGLVAGLLDVFRLERVDVLGYSWGGLLAQQFARDEPARVRRLVLASTTPGLGGFPPGPWAMLPALSLTTVLLRQHTRPLGYAAQLYAYTGWTSLPWLHRVPHRTLVVGGRKDPLVPVQNLRLLASRLPHARLEILPDAGHLWLLERPDRGAAIISDFLDN